jgi:hypothetical protein
MHTTPRLLCRPCNSHSHVASDPGDCQEPAGKIFGGIDQASARFGKRPWWCLAETGSASTNVAVTSAWFSLHSLEELFTK